MPFKLREPDYVPPSKGRGSKLTAKMLAFIDYYMIDSVGKEAVLKAGYKTKNPELIAAGLLKHPLVSAEIKARQEIRREKTELTAEFLIQKLVSIIKDTERDNPQAALRGIELAGKTLGIFKDRQEISGPDGESIKIEQDIKKKADDFASKLSRLSRRADDEELVEPDKVVNIR